MKRMLTVLLSLILMVSSAAAMSAADSLTALGLLQGTPSGLALDRPVTRAEAVVMLLRIKGETPTDAPIRFTDAEGHWAEKAIQYAASKHYVDGVSKTEFAPDRPITHAECCKLFDLPVETSNTFTRGDFVELIFQMILQAKEKLLAHNAVSQEKYDAVFGSPYAQRLYARLPHTENNMISPFSLRMALAMAANGASGETQRELLATLGIDSLPDYNAHAQKAFSLFAACESTQVSTANSIWLNTSNTGVDFSKEFQSTIADSYAAEAHTVTDQNAVWKMNTWIKEKTNGRITNLVSDPPQLAALVNTIYFKAKWMWTFDPAETSREPFTSLDGKKTDLDFMHGSGKYDYYEDENKRMIELPYYDDFSLFVLLPKTDAPVNLFTGIRATEPTEVILALPKFESRCKKSFQPLLKALGIERAFSDTMAEFAPMFSGLSEKTPQETYIKLDEEGTEAAGVTEIELGGSPPPSEPPVPIEFRADRPFTYFIWDYANNEILFLGEYVKPE